MLSDDRQEAAGVSRNGPPPLPPGAVYTSCYCEENVYLLAETFHGLAAEREDWAWDAHAVFISNAAKTVGDLALQR